jgi:lipoyl(octanoyl) transferase
LETGDQLTDGLPPLVPTVSRSLAVHDLGTIAYGDALALQRRLADDRLSGKLEHDLLLLCDHPPVITLGRGTKDSSLPLDPESLRRRGIEVFEVERGGDVTYHGPGQLVGYPIFHLGRHRQDLHWYLRQLEEVLIVALREFGIVAERNAGYTGVWTSGRKIASIGVHVKQWVTWHGFALNVTTDLSPFDLIVPCGIPGVVMTSVAREAAGGQADDRTGGRADERTIGPTDHMPHDEATGDLGVAARAAVVRAFERVFAFDAVERPERLP